ncbi:response regulator transcription factor [Clostridium sp. UBA7503]|uniref:response regulator transcription factor n=1 Tax=Clostridium sp. UBA7503 TaxID=1946377 RepID=UPI003217D125
MKEILLVEDDLDLSKELSLSLSKWGFKANVIENFDRILKEFIEKNPQLVIMDVNLPYYDGFYWCKKIREVSKVPIIFLSSRDCNMDLVMGINNGGDDYITKPFSMEVLITKINALLRRTYDYAGNDSIMYYNNAVLDMERCTFKYGNNIIELTKNEIKILSVLIKSRGKIVSRDRLMMSLWNDDEFVSDNTLTVNVTRLRNKIKEIGLDDFIKTKKGIGYMV